MSVLQKVLIVDDEPGYREHLQALLAAEGYDVESAANSAAAIEAGRRFLPDVLVVDWQLREELDGFDVSNTLRETLPDLRTILITGYAIPSLDSKVITSKIRAVLFKPFGIDDLREAVRRATTEA